MAQQVNYLYRRVFLFDHHETQKLIHTLKVVQAGAGTLETVKALLEDLDLSVNSADLLAVALTAQGLIQSLHEADAAAGAGAIFVWNDGEPLRVTARFESRLDPNWALFPKGRFVSPGNDVVDYVIHPGGFMHAAGGGGSYVEFRLKNRCPSGLEKGLMEGHMVGGDGVGWQITAGAGAEAVQLFSGDSHLSIENFAFLKRNPAGKWIEAFSIVGIHNVPRWSYVDFRWIDDRFGAYRADDDH